MKKLVFLHLSISTLFKIISSSLERFNRLIKKRGREITLKTLSFVKKDFFALSFSLLLAISLIIVNGSSTDGQTSLVSHLFSKEIEEVPLYLSFANQAQSAEFRDGGAFLGLGDHSVPLNSINTLQQTALLAFNSPENDLSGLSDSKSNQITIYTVQEGDTLSFIASDFGISTNTIIWANNLNNIHSLKPGDELKIPPIDGVIHKVRKGDTVNSIAKKYGAEREKIIAFNILPQDGSLQIDEELIIPDGKISVSQPAGNQSPAVKRFAYLPSLGDFFMLPATGRNWGRIHGRNGVDIANSCGTPIYAAASGIVAIADAVGWNGGFGKFIKLIHTNGTETIYAHNSKILVQSGQSIEKGEQISVMGTTGHSTGCHLHFEVHGARNPLAKY